MRPKLRSFSRYRPRLLTLALFCLTAAVLLLANLSMEIRKRGAPAPKSAIDLVFDVRKPNEWYHEHGTAQNVSYGWPLLWRQHVFVHDMTSYGIVGECYSAPRLTADIALWLGLYDIEQPYHERIEARPLLSHVPAFPRLEAVAVLRCSTGDLRYLARLPRLKMLTLVHAGNAHAELVKLASLENLEELAIGYGVISAKGLESLCTSKHLQRLHLQGLDHGPGSDVVPAVDASQLDGCLRALGLLRQSKPEIIIDNLDEIHLWPEQRLVLREDASSDYERNLWLRELLQKWKQQNAPGRFGFFIGP